jgi:hypothetical protein
VILKVLVGLKTSMLVFRLLRRMDLQLDGNVSEEHSASIFRGDVHTALQTRRPASKYWKFNRVWDRVLLQSNIEFQLYKKLSLLFQVSIEKLKCLYITGKLNEFQYRNKM